MPQFKRRRGRPSAIAKLTVSQLMEEIDRRRAMVGSLAAQRDDLVSQLEAINAEISELESISGNTTIRASPQVPIRRRGLRRRSRSGRGNKDSLAAVLHALLRGKTMSVPEMADAAKETGYKSKSKNFRAIIGLTILKNKTAFKRVSRGQYTAK